MSGRRGIAVAACLLLAAVSVWVVRDHTREDSLSADEPIHILSGYFAVASHSAIVNIEHPPLLKALSGLALRTLPLRPPPPRVPMGNFFVDYGPDFFYANTVPPDRIIAAARSPFLVVLAALIVLVFAAALGRYGAAAAFFAAALCALDPNILAHAGVVHTDLGAALGFLASVLSWEAARRRPTAARLALAGVCLGLALTAKFSAVYLVPILLLQTLIASVVHDRAPGVPRGADARRVGGDLLRLLVVFVAAVLVVVAVYATVTSGMDAGDQAAVIREKVGAFGHAPELAERIVRIASFSRPLAHYLGGVASVARQNAVGGGVTFLNGKIATQGFPQYFFVAFGVKSTLAFLAVTAAILWALLRKGSGYSEEARLFLLPVVVLFLASIGTTYNIGIRHLLPVYPFLALFGAAIFARVLEKRRTLPTVRARAAAALWMLLPALSAVELARIHPHELSYFNPLAGGPAAGARILSDSNIDWGLDLIRLAAELKRRGVRDATVVYFGGDRVDYRVGVPAFQARPVVRGRLVAISVFLRTAGPEFYAYHGDTDLAQALRSLQGRIASGRDVGRIGYSIDLVELPAGDNP
ncbi:MAG TPA: phospholipid carrier-dependent glycosyltransferase [Thermoanaerobaculia bacterium]